MGTTSCCNKNYDNTGLAGLDKNNGEVDLKNMFSEAGFSGDKANDNPNEAAEEQFQINVECADTHEHHNKCFPMVKSQVKKIEITNFDKIALKIKPFISRKSLNQNSLTQGLDNLANLEPNRWSEKNKSTSLLKKEKSNIDKNQQSKFGKDFRSDPNHTLSVSSDQGLIEVSEKDEEMIKENVKKLFPKLSSKEISSFVKQFYYQELEAGTTLVKRLESCFLFIVKSGKVGLIKNEDLIMTFNEGGCFGNINSIKNTGEDRMVFKCIEKTGLYIISGQQIKIIKNDILEKKHIKFIKVLNSIPLLKSLIQSDKLAVIDELVTKQYAKGDVIQEQNKKADCFYYIIEGSVEKGIAKMEQAQAKQKTSTVTFKLSHYANLHHCGTEVSMGINSFFNEDIFLEDSNSKYYYKSKGCILVCITTDALNRLFRGNFRDYLLCNFFFCHADTCSTIKRIVNEYHFNDEELESESVFDFPYFDPGLMFNNFIMLNITQGSGMSPNNRNLIIYHKIFKLFTFKIYKESDEVMNSHEHKLIFIVKGSILNVRFLISK